MENHNSIVKATIESALLPKTPGSNCIYASLEPSNIAYPSIKETPFPTFATKLDFVVASAFEKERRCIRATSQ